MNLTTDAPPQIVFVDGIGGRRFFRGVLSRHVARRGHAFHHVGYRPSRESFHTIRARLGDRLGAIAANGPYVAIGYSFGGVLVRSALTTRPELARPLRLVLVASPMHSLRMCRAVRNRSIFRWLTGDCGKLLASETGMQAVALPDVPTTCIYGTRGYVGPFAPAGRGPNDGMVAVAEIDPLRFDDVVTVHASHPSMPSSRPVLAAIDARLSSVA